ncbi:MAG TPA: glutamate racemase [Candidatus Binatia bacterium]|nr:glutamate racemase [Candidatus Binatia bacterium]
MKIGVFDSGLGGLSVARAIQLALPEHEVIFVNDVRHMPYGSKPPEELLGYVSPILQKLAGNGCSVIVIACNTVSTTLIDILRHELSVPLVPVEPMVKPAADKTKTNVIAVCATPTTLASARYTKLKDTYAVNAQVLEPDCSDWAYMIEHNEIDQVKIRRQIEAVLAKGADVIVLGCTHYHWIEEEIKAIARDKAIVMQPEQSIIAQVKQVLAQLA